MNVMFRICGVKEVAMSNIKFMMLLMLTKTLRFMVMLFFNTAEEVAFDKDHRGCRLIGRSGRSCCKCN